MLGSVAIGSLALFEVFGGKTAIFLYLLGAPLGSSLGYLFSVWWVWSPRMKIVFAVVGPTIGAILSLFIFYIVIIMSGENALLAFWTAFTIANAAVLFIGRALPRYVTKE